MISHQDLMRFIDGELPPEERIAIERRLEASSELRRELAVYQSMKEGFRALTFAPVLRGTSVWDRIRTRLTTPAGWILVSVGFAAWIAYGLWVILTSSSSVLVRIGTAGVSIGILVLLANAIWDRFREYRTDPYRDVHR